MLQKTLVQQRRPFPVLSIDILSSSIFFFISTMLLCCNFLMLSGIISSHFVFPLSRRFQCRYSDAVRAWQPPSRQHLFLQVETWQRFENTFVPWTWGWVRHQKNVFESGHASYKLVGYTRKKWVIRLYLQKVAHLNLSSAGLDDENSFSQWMALASEAILSRFWWGFFLIGSQHM